jgi:hypothetical protein
MDQTLAGLISCFTAEVRDLSGRVDELESSEQRRRSDIHALARENHELRNEGCYADGDDREEHTVRCDGGHEDRNDPCYGPGDDRLVEDRSDADSPTDLGDVWVAGLPFGKLVKTNKEFRNETADRLDELDTDRHDGPAPEDLLPIQNVERIWRSAGQLDELQDEHAAAIWSDFFDRKIETHDELVLNSKEVRRVLLEHFRMDDRHAAVDRDIERSTVHRAMDQVDHMGGGIVNSEVKNGRRTLIINKQELRDFRDSLDAVTNDVTGSEGSGVTAEA